MNKTFLIIRREYLTRVRKKTFIIATLLFPLLYLGLIFGSAYLGAKSQSDINVAVIDSSGFFDKGQIERANHDNKSSNLKMTLVEHNPDSMASHLKQSGYDGLVIIPADTIWNDGLANVVFKADKKFGNASEQIKARLNSMWDDVKNEKLGIDENKKKTIRQSRVTIKTTDIGGKDTNEKTPVLIAFVAGFLIYFILMIYGSQVMMGVMEEKTSRIAEVIVSSVKPFQLMLGKIVGIGLVALTQFLLWIAFIFIIYNITKATGGRSEMMSGMVGQVQQAFGGINLPLIIFCFAFYFLGGFFFYASLYAAIGSAVNEDMREAQSLAFPVTILVIFSIIMLSSVINDPNGPIAFWGSMIPFSSPIIMMGRVPFGVPGTVPLWELILSMVILVASFIFSVWLSGKIYRTGILMYGKKPTWKEMFKWVFRKN
jgi:ABC-2 type transport system permease protein